MSATRTELIRVRVSPEEHAALRQRAEREGRTLSGWLRHLGLTLEAHGPRAFVYLPEHDPDVPAPTRRV